MSPAGALEQARPCGGACSLPPSEQAISTANPPAQGPGGTAASSGESEAQQPARAGARRDPHGRFVSCTRQARPRGAHIARQPSGVPASASRPARAAPPSGQRSPNCAPAYAPGRKPTAPARTRTLHRPRPHPQQAARTRRSPTSSGMACAPATGPDVGKPIEPDTGASPGQRAFGTSPPVRHGQLAAWIARDQYRPAGNGPNGCPARINLTVFAFPRKYAKRGSGLRDAHHQPARNTAASGASADLGSTQDRPRTTL